MSNDPPAEKKLPLHRRFLPTTVAGKAALACVLALLMILVLVWALRLFGSQSVRLSHAMTAPRMLLEFALVILIPAVLYWGIRQWNRVIEGEYPDIDQAWQAGIDALQAQGISPSDYPLFLILGSSDEHVEHGLMEALDTKLAVHGIPDASGVGHALQWYRSDDAIYLFCPGASSLSALMGRWTTPTSKSGSLRPIGKRSDKPAPASTSPDDPIGVPELERASQPVPQAPAASTEDAPQALRKESSMKPSPSGNQTAPEPYLGTLQLQSVESSPAENPSPPRRSVFDHPGDVPPASSPTPANPGGTSATEPPMRPAPKYEGTLSFDHHPQPSAADSGSSRPPGPDVQRSGRSQRATSEAGSSEPGTLTPRTAKPSARPDAAKPVGHSRETASDTAIQSTSEQTTSKPPSGSGTGGPLPMSRSGSKKVALPASLDTSDQLPRLQYVCKLLHRVRRPTCGVNGLITLIPFSLSRVGPLQLSAIAQSARSDVGMVQETLGIRVPVTAVLVGLEQEKGFIELVRRLQPGLLTRRLGGRFDLRSRPTPDELNSHSDRLCDAFEDWVYRLFSRDDGLAQQRGNRKLYALTSKIRHELKPRLRIVLGQAFGCDSRDEPGDQEPERSFFFSGCYFAASGEATGQPAFVQGVLRDKLLDEQSKVQWTEDSLRTHWLFRVFAVIGWIVTAILAALIAAQLMMGR